jgi:hypothetical protein
MAVALLAILLVPRLVSATPVSLELMLLVDVSGSVDSSEYNLQKQGYVDAFNDAAIQALIAGATGGIAVAYAEWSGAGEQSLLVNWTHLTDAASSSAFATAIGGTSRAFGGSTAPGSAINWSVPLFANGFEGARTVIDVSGDGSQNDGANTASAAAAAHALGYTVNGLPILGSEANLDTWYQNNIVTPGGGFLVVASGFDDFSAAVTRKIGREITPAPEPATMSLLALGLAAAARRRFARKSQAVA